MVKLSKANPAVPSSTRAILISAPEPAYAVYNLDNHDIAYINRLKQAKKSVITLGKGDNSLFIQHLEPHELAYKTVEAARMAGATLAAELRSHKINEITLAADTADAGLLLAYAEGTALGAYRFSGYKKDNNSETLHIALEGNVSTQALEELQATIDGVYFARNLVNTPFSHQNAEQLSASIQAKGQELGFKVEVLNKSKIEALKMGGLLSVAAGSLDPPTFNILEWKPDNAVNTRPVIFVGKGVVFDTGGLTLKPTPNSMDLMKSDMAGAAAVAGAFQILAQAKLPYHVIGLIPATDNRPGVRATAPGDVITMFGGTTVEVMNTDAEGRLILGDALEYAKKYDPEIVIDLATLTGAAAKAIGQFGIVFMGTASAEDKRALQQSGENTYERLVELPLWEEYGDLIKSDIADMKNVSAGANAGAITAGKFLEHFTAGYPWMHLDIAGSAYISSADGYRSKNATGTGVRLLINFLKNKYSHAK